MTVSEQFKNLKRTHEVDVGTIHHFSDGLYAKQMHLPAGYLAYSHKHTYSHLSLLAKGVAVVTTDHGSQTYRAPACINIVANEHHEILALEDVTWFCIHATTETDADKVDQVLIGEE
jgi:quercetin dioxygenase-like cupin family protein